MPGIIVGVDGSAHSQWALQWAMNEAAARHAPLTVVSVHHGKAISYTEGDLNLDQAAEELQALVDMAVSRRPGPELPVTVAAIAGSPAAELIGAARDADLLVVGSRGRDGLGRRGLGSVSSQAASEARCPVVIIFGPSVARLRAVRAAVSWTDTRRLPPLAAPAAASQP
jgi:nucleotide-binding universal stress UspA family protein